MEDDQLPSQDDVEAGLILRAVHALGITTARWVADYYRMDRRATPDRVRELAAAGELVETHVDGWSDVAYMHPANVELAERAADDALPAALTTLLSPFDPLFWDRARVRTMFGFDYTIECYTPAARRRWGYFVLPLLRRGELIGRIDAKAHRRDGVFEVKSLYLEAGIRVTDALLRDVARALREAADWHATPDVTVTRTEPASLREPLLRALRHSVP
ncbi:hypothetical protein BH23GEM10_BH23GEM10_15170 [soil metagenome]